MDAHRRRRNDGFVTQYWFRSPGAAGEYPRDEAKNPAWVRAFYRDLFAETGDAYDGALINHSDINLADPAGNTSGVPWSTLYYQDNYPRLQRMKSQWDPRNVFRHALSTRAG
ncbi:MAG: BBE domain-containing protein [Bryobacteraceae bacterium]